VPVAGRAFGSHRSPVTISLLRDGAGAQTGDGVRRVVGRAPRSFADFAREHAAAFADEPVDPAPPI
jgi:hypothetical protein